MSLLPFTKERGWVGGFPTFNSPITYVFYLRYYDSKHFATTCTMDQAPRLKLESVKTVRRIRRLVQKLRMWAMHIPEALHGHIHIAVTAVRVIDGTRRFVCFE
jgi:hypothetical protein